METQWTTSRKDNAPLELSYAVCGDEGDARAEAALLKAFRIILALGAIATLLWLCRMCWIYLESGYGLSSVLDLLYPNLIAVTLAFLGLRALRARSRWVVPLFWVSFFLGLATPTGVLLWGGSLSDRLFQFSVNFGTTCPLALIMILYPILRGRPTEVWLRRLTAFSIVLLVFQLSTWFCWTAHLLVMRARWPGGGFEVSPVPLPEVGSLFAAALLYVFRRRLSRIVICTAAGYYLWQSTRLLAFPDKLGPYYESFYDYLAHQYFQQVANFLKALAAGLPLWMLVWFAFRFTRSERQAIHSTPALSQVPELARDASNA